LARMLLFACACICSQLLSANAATVTTDKADYAPGETAYITGSGFTAGETVQCQVLHIPDTGDNNTSSAHLPWSVTADGNGSFSTTWDVPLDQDELGATLQLTASGQSSGVTAQTTFTDATSNTTLASGKNPSCSGQNVTFTATVSKQGGSGSGNPTGTVTFKDGATTIGSASLIGIGSNTSTGALTTASLITVGTHSITAVYGGDGTYSASTSAALTQIIDGSAPSISVPPASQTVCAGGSVTFSVTASGSDLTYQWRKGGIAISAATGTSYTINPVALSDAGTFDVVVST